MKKQPSDNASACRLNKVGGQAVLEGVMMKAGKRTVTTCRKEDGTLVVYDNEFVSVRKKHKILGLPIIRGVVNFIEMMILSMKTLNDSADALGIEEEDGKFERFCKKVFGASATNVIMAVSLILGLGLSVLLFIVLPSAVTNGINWIWGNWLNLGSISATWSAIIEGAVKVLIFLGYLTGVSFMKDIRRTFMYHGAEHKTIACFEAGEELTPENAMKHKRFHPRCGTSFMFLMIGIGVIVGILIRNLIPDIEDESLNTLVVVGVRLALLPLTMGIGYEILMIAGKHDNFLTRLISAPGLWVQRITTKEPTPDMLECAIISTKCALRDEFPEFMEFWNEKSWEKKDEGESTDPADDSGNAEKASSDELAPIQETAADTDNVTDPNTSAAAAEENKDTVSEAKEEA